jgi:hypothetical protein
MMRWGLTKSIWEKCRFTETDLTGQRSDLSTCLFTNVGTTVPETVFRHVYGLILSNEAATYNNVHMYHVPDGATGTQYFLKFFHLGRGGDSGNTPRAQVTIPNDPDPLKPLFALEGGSKLYANAATASMHVTVMYWDDILTGVED